MLNFAKQIDLWPCKMPHIYNIQVGVQNSFNTKVRYRGADVSIGEGFCPLPDNGETNRTGNVPESEEGQMRLENVLSM